MSSIIIISNNDGFELNHLNSTFMSISYSNARFIWWAWIQQIMNLLIMNLKIKIIVIIITIIIIILFNNVKKNNFVNSCLTSLEGELATQI